MPPLTLFSAVLVMGVSPVDSAAVAEAPPVAAVAESSLRSASEHIRQLAFDGDAETYFASEGNPDAADYFSLVFDKPVKVKSIVVATGRPDGKDKLEAGASRSRPTASRSTNWPGFRTARPTASRVAERSRRSASGPPPMRRPR